MHAGVMVANIFGRSRQLHTSHKKKFQMMDVFIALYLGLNIKALSQKLREQLRVSAHPLI